MHFFKPTVAIAVMMATSSVAMAYGEPPTGWSIVSGASTANVKIYKKNGSETYAQVVNMKAGAKVELKQTYVGMTASPYNGNMYRGYQRNHVSTWFANAGNPVSVVNGDYFVDLQKTPSVALLSFGVRANGTQVDPGSDPVNDRQIEFFPGSGAVTMYAHAGAIQSGPAANIIGGYSPAKAASPSVYRGRTGLCTIHPTIPSELVLILTHKSATQSIANSDFASWRCTSGSQIMMDGSASAQLSYKQNGVQKNVLGVAQNNQTGRTVPQVIVVRNN